MKTKKIPVKIPLEGNGSIYDVLNQFINTMEAVTGGNVDLFCDFQGNITVHYEGDKEVLPTPSIKNNPYNLEQLLFPEEFETRADVKSATMRERKSSKL